MKKCPYCNSSLHDEAQFCLFCMEQLCEKNVITVKTRRKNTAVLVLSIILSVVLTLVCAGVIIFSLHNSQDTSATPSHSSTHPSEPSSKEPPITSSPNAFISLDDDSSSNVAINTDGSSSSNESVLPSSSDTLSTPQSSASEDKMPPAAPYTYKSVAGGIEITGLSDAAITDCVIPSEIDGKQVVGIATRAFYYNNTIKTITLPDSLNYIGEQAFYGVSKIETILIPKNVSKIGASAFVECSRLSSVYIASQNIQIATYAFSNSSQRNVGLTIYASSAVMNKYTALAWDAEFVEWYK